MAAVIKKRALLEYSNANQTSSQEVTDKSREKHKKIRLTAKLKGSIAQQHINSSDYHENISALEQLNDLIKSSNESVNVSDIIHIFLLESNDSVNIKQIYMNLLTKINESTDAIVKTSYINVIKLIISKYDLVKHLISINTMIDHLLAIINRETSHVVIAHLMDTLHVLAKFDINYEERQKVIACAKHLLRSNSSHIVKNESLNVLVDFAPINNQNCNQFVDTANTHIQTDCIAIIKLLRDFSHYYDSRVRSTALSCILRLYERGVHLDISLYSEFCESLNDDYEVARITAVKLLEVMSHLYGDCLVCVNYGDEQIRLADDAFAKVCSMINDPSMNVRSEAASLLGKFTHISANFLEQTLDKKLMSNLKRKKSAHERHRDNYATGEWSSGQKWADDMPHEELCPDTVNLMNIGACGAFIHGLEDEYFEVRMSTLRSLSQLAQQFPIFANQALDFLVDMFNDEIEDIRLEAIQCLSNISLESIVLREDQIEIILAVLEDFSIDIREALHSMLGNCKLSSKAALKTCIMNLLENLKRYPQDKNSIWKCFQKLGMKHPYLTLPLVSDLLGIHPFLDLPETSLEDNGYVAILILVFNAAKDCVIMFDLFEKHTIRHYFYLRDTYPLLVPHLTILDNDGSKLSSNQSLSTNSDNSSSHTFLLVIFERVRNIMCLKTATTEVQTAILSHSIRDLQRLGEVQPALSFASTFLYSYLQCQMSLRRILANNNWINTFLLSPLQSSSFRASLQQLLSATFSLTNRFHGLHPIQLICIQQTRLKAMALQLIAIIHGSNVSALALCDAFLSEIEYLEKLLEENNLQADQITKSMIKEINLLEEPKPGTVARVLQPLFLSSSVSQIADLDMMLNEVTFTSLVKLSMTNASINEPTCRDTPLKFTAGLILGLQFDAVIENVSDVKNIRIKIQYPDQQTQIVLPKLNDFRLIERQNNDDCGVNNYRLYTTIYLSHGVWTESCHVEVGLILDYRDTTCTTLNTFHTWSALGSKAIATKSTKSEDNLIIQICKPVRVYISPKQPKKGVI